MPCAPCTVVRAGSRPGSMTPGAGPTPSTPRSNLSPAGGPGFRFSILERKWLRWPSGAAGPAGGVTSGSGGSELDA